MICREPPHPQPPLPEGGDYASFYGHRCENRYRPRRCAHIPSPRGEGPGVRGRIARDDLSPDLNPWFTSWLPWWRHDPPASTYPQSARAAAVDDAIGRSAVAGAAQSAGGRAQISAKVTRRLLRCRFPLSCGASCGRGDGPGPAPQTSGAAGCGAAGPRLRCDQAGAGTDRNRPARRAVGDRIGRLPSALKPHFTSRSSGNASSFHTTEEPRVS